MLYGLRCAEEFLDFPPSLVSGDRRFNAHRIALGLARKGGGGDRFTGMTQAGSIVR